jgi:hypothetical protein
MGRPTMSNFLVAPVQRCRSCEHVGEARLMPGPIERAVYLCCSRCGERVKLVPKALVEQDTGQEPVVSPTTRRSGKKIL